MSTICDFTFQRQVRRLHQLGARVLGELLLEIDADPQRDVRGRLARYADLDLDVLHQTGGDKFPARPLTLVPTNAMNKVAMGAADRGEILRAALVDGGPA